MALFLNKINDKVTEDTDKFNYNMKNTIIVQCTGKESNSLGKGNVEVKRNHQNIPILYTLSSLKFLWVIPRSIKSEVETNMNLKNQDQQYRFPINRK